MFPTAEEADSEDLRGALLRTLCQQPLFRSLLALPLLGGVGVTLSAVPDNSCKRALVSISDYSF